MTLFAVIRTRGRAWLSDRGLEDQPRWREHADFMNGLAEEGVVVLGGPLEGTPDVLLIVRGESAEAISQRLGGDPWTHLELLRILSITPWTIRLGAPQGA
jgi:uncharacterized protein YciI